jgi:hypothetical protein
VLALKDHALFDEAGRGNLRAITLNALDRSA